MKFDAVLDISIGRYLDIIGTSQICPVGKKGCHFRDDNNFHEVHQKVIHYFVFIVLKDFTYHALG